MLCARSSNFLVARPCWSLLTLLILVLCSGCGQSPATTYSTDEAIALWHTRATKMADQLNFSFRLDPVNVPIGQEIFFVATLTNTTDLPIVFREPRQSGVLAVESYDKTLLFSIEPINEGLSITYPGEGFVQLLPEAIQPDMFMTLPPHSSREFRLRLPHMVQTKVPSATVFSKESVPLPVGRYRVQMTYYNEAIGFDIKGVKNADVVDLNAWVGKIEGEPVTLTITPNK
jgi:hypothetical protein